MSRPDTEFIELFRDETARRLDQMDTLLLAIESGDAGAETIDSLFRHAHTIKGAAGMLGFDDVRALAHATEDVLARCVTRRVSRRRSPRRCCVRPPRAGEHRRVRRAHRRRRRRPRRESRSAARRPGSSREPARRAGKVPEHAGDAANGTAAGEPADRRPRQRSRHGLPRQAGAQGAGRHRAARAHAAGPGRQDRPPARRGRRDHAAPDAGWRTPWATRRGSPQDVADAFGAGERMLDDLKDTAVGMRTLPLAVITAGAAARGPGPRPGRGQGGRVRGQRARTPSSTG